MKFILLDKREPRCRPIPPNTVLHNDCGKQKECARRLAANTTGAPEFDFSHGAQPLAGGIAFHCAAYLNASEHAERAGAPR